jgi:hypothetical protein
MSIRRPAPPHVDMSPALKRLTHPVPAIYLTAALAQRGTQMAQAEPAKPPKRSAAQTLYPNLK